MDGKIPEPGLPEILLRNARVELSEHRDPSPLAELARAAAGDARIERACVAHDLRVQ